MFWSTTMIAFFSPLLFETELPSHMKKEKKISISYNVGVQTSNTEHCITQKS
jgi:hypothetical protein